MTIEPNQPSKKIHNLSQWLTAKFVAIYVEKYPTEAPKLMKYCEVVRDIGSKPGDFFYDELFRYVRQSAPDNYLWDTIHWELWLQAVINFRAQPEVSFDKVTTRSQNHQSFPKKTCLAFHSGWFCGGMPLCSRLFQVWLTPPCKSIFIPWFTMHPPCTQSNQAPPLAEQSGHSRESGQAWFPFAWLCYRFKTIFDWRFFFWFSN